MKNVTIEELIETIDNHANTGAKIVRITTDTEPKTNKKHRETGIACPWEIRKTTARVVMLGTSYEKAVNRQRERESQPLNADDSLVYFRAEALFYGKGIHDGTFTAHHADDPTRRYIVYRPMSDDDNNAINLEDRWYDAKTGETLTLDQVKPYLPPISPSKKQQTDKLVLWRTLKFESLLQLAYAGEDYVVKNVTAPAELVEV